jgi:4-hydroxybenzoate polyprenyltransferase
LCLSGLLSYWGGYSVATGGDGLAAPTGLILFAVAATYWMTLVGVPAKDLSDIAGDAAAGRRTIGVTCGATVSRRIMLIAAFVLVAGFSAAVLVTGVPLAGCCVALAAGSFGLLLVSRDGSDDRRLQRRPYRVFMATQHLVHITALISNI